jgi:hypothetical protein
MRFAAGPPAMWRISLISGAEIELWADACAMHPVDREWVFSILVEATPDEQRAVRVQHSSVPSEQVVVTVARIPVGEVAAIEGGWSLADDPRGTPDPGAEPDQPRAQQADRCRAGRMTA